jgi:long-chain acyl-CoA synthetase
MTAGGSGPAAEERTLVKLLVAAARAHPRRPAMREREKGIWREYTRAAVMEHVRRLTLGLHALGLGPDDKLAIISTNRPEAFWTIYAAQALRAVPVPIYQDAIAKEVQYVVDHSDARFVLAEDQEQVDKLVEVRPGLPHVERVFYDDPKGLRRYDRDWLLPLAEVEARGREVEARDPELFDRLLAAGRPDDVAIIAYTSGTTGSPKGAMLTHRNLIAGAEQFLRRERLEEGDEVLSYLPLAWVGETAYSIALGVVRGLTVNFPERAETVLANLREIGPHLFLGPPRMWENSHSEIEVKIEDATPLKRWMFRRLVPVGEEVARRRMEGRPVPLGLRARWLLGELLVFRPLRDQRGARRIRYAYTGGASLAPEIILFYRGIGVNLKQIYGQTENAAFFCGQPDGRVKLGTVGMPYPGVELRLTPEGEICSRGPTIFAGYYKNPDATREAVRDGWLHSGDAGFLDPDGQLVVVDRLKDVTRLADGTTLAPQFLENKLKFSPYVKEAVVVGPGRPYVAAMVNIDLATVGKWAERRQMGYTTYADLASRPEVYDLVGGVVERANGDLPAGTRIRRFLLLPKELDPDDEEITRTRKLRRRVIAEKYARYIEALYGPEKEIEVSTTVTYEDGRRATLQHRVQIRDVEPERAATGG